jgi:hypothetical protein
MAAGVVVVASVVMLRPGQQPNLSVPSEHRVAENKVPAPPADSKADATFDVKTNSVAPPAKLPSSLASGSPARPARSAVDESLRADRNEFVSEPEHTRAARGSVARLSIRARLSGTKRFFYQNKKSRSLPQSRRNPVPQWTDQWFRFRKRILNRRGERNRPKLAPAEEGLMVRQNLKRFDQEPPAAKGEAITFPEFHIKGPE